MGPILIRIAYLLILGVIVRTAQKAVGTRYATLHRVTVGWLGAIALLTPGYIVLLIVWEIRGAPASAVVLDLVYEGLYIICILLILGTAICAIQMKTPVCRHISHQRLSTDAANEGLGGRYYPHGGVLTPDPARLLVSHLLAKHHAEHRVGLYHDHC